MCPRLSAILELKFMMVILSLCLSVAGERERDYLDAISSYYKDWDTKDKKPRSLLYEKKMEAIYLKYTDDIEAAVFYALALHVFAHAGLPHDKKGFNYAASSLSAASLRADRVARHDRVRFFVAVRRQPPRQPPSEPAG